MFWEYLNRCFEMKSFSSAIIFQDGTMRMCDDIVLGDLYKDDF